MRRNDKSKFFFVFTFLLVFFYVLTLPLYSYAGTVYYDGFKLSANGVGRVASAAAGLGGRYALARAVLSRLPYVGLVVTVGLLVYDQYNRRGGDVPVQITVPGMAQNDNSNQYTTYKWGTHISGGYSAVIAVYSETYKTAEEVCSPDTDGYKYFPNMPVKSFPYTHVTESSPVCATCVITGGLTEVRTDLGANVLQRCDATGNPQQVYTIMRSTRIWVEFVPASWLTSPTPQVISPESAPLDSTSGKGNTESMVQTVQLAQSQLNQILNAIKLTVPKNSDGTSPSTKSIDDTVKKAKDDLIEPLDKGYLPVSPTDIEDTGLVPKLIPEPSPVTLPSNEPPPEEKIPPPISDGSCGDYQYKNDWSRIKTDISVALQNLPLYGLINKLGQLTGSAGLPHQYTLDLTSVGLGSPKIDLDAFYLGEVIAVLRWIVLAGGFLVAWHIAVGGDS